MVIKSKYALVLLLCLTFGLIHSQNDSLKLDSVKLEEVTVNAYLEERPVLKLPASVAVIDMTQLFHQPPQSFVTIFNTVPGVRMEERSPGSYRLSIRGSLIRSPFGVRNTKIYLDEFPLTNAGGDAYLNLLDMSNISTIEILKGPDGSLFGANSGGVVRISPVNLRTASSVNIGVSAGSFGLFRQNVGVQQKFKNNTLSINQAWQRSDGYRKNSAMDRKYFQLADQFNYSTKGHVKLFLFYSDLKYETPGGLTLAQFKEDPTAARPATKLVPGAEEQQAGIRNRTLFGGIQHEIKFTDRIKHVIAIFGSRTLFENPFITNYETRDETNGGLRTWFEFKNNAGSGIRLTCNIGVEAQDLQSHISNYGNDHGSKDTIQAADELTVNQGFVFTRLVANFYNKWTVEASLSYNYNALSYSRKVPMPLGMNNDFHQKRFAPQFMPRVAASYLVTNYFSLRAIVSRGYSPPTLQEIRASDNSINTALQPEEGWNYEAGIRLNTNNSRFWWDASVFYYQLNHAIVKQINEVGQDYFVNSGGTYQPGFESQITLQLVKPNSYRAFRKLTLTHAYTFQAYTFRNYRSSTENFSGNDVTGVPQHMSVTGLNMQLPLGFYLFTQYNYTDRIPLNDANTEYAAGYHLVQVIAGWTYKTGKRFMMEICAGADNLLDQSYSLGNDLNAIGNRYYNAAPGRNYFSKLNLWF